MNHADLRRCFQILRSGVNIHPSSKAECGVNEVAYKKCLGGASGKEAAASAGNVRDAGLIPGLGRSPGGGHGNPLWYSCVVISAWVLFLVSGRTKYK